MTSSSSVVDFPRQQTGRRPQSFQKQRRDAWRQEQSQRPQNGVATPPAVYDTSDLPEVSQLNESLLSFARKVLGQYLINIDEVAQILSLGIASGRNIILYGPGGHAKSEAIEILLRALGLWDKHTHIQSMSTDSTVADLFGGIDIRALNRDDELRYLLERSVFGRTLGVLEEGLDAPGSVLAALKDALTSGRVRISGGTESEVFQSRLRVLIIPTNRDPNEVAGMGPTVAALMERFPLQVHVRWNSYGEGDFEKLFQKLEGVARQFRNAPTPLIKPGYVIPTQVDLNGTREYLSYVLGEAVKQGRAVSPRTAAIAAELVRIFAHINGRKKCELKDLAVLQYVPGLEGVEVSRIVQEEFSRRGAVQVLRAAEKTIADISAKNYSNETDARRDLNILEQVEEHLTNGTLKVPNGYVPQWEQLKGSVARVKDRLTGRIRGLSSAVTWDPFGGTHGSVR